MIGELETILVMLAWKLASTRLVSDGAFTNWLARDFCNTNDLSDEAWAGAVFYDGVRTTRTLRISKLGPSWRLEKHPQMHYSSG
jgi:hypothetical protein